MTDDRASLRRLLRERRRALPAAERIAGAEAVARHLLALPFAPVGGHVGGYWATDGEVGLHAWQMHLPPEVRYCLPCLHGDGVLRFAPWRPGEPLVTNRYGIPEPDVPVEALLPAEALEMIVLPLVGFDPHGHRLGMGGGWYDRTLASRHASPAPPYLVGAAFAVQQLVALTPEPWDVPLDAACTEAATHLFHRNAA